MLELAMTQTQCHEFCRGFPGGRKTLARWCRYAAFPLPADLPEVVTIFRGGRGGDIEALADGTAWTLDPDCACYFAIYRGGANGMVIRAEIPRSEIMFFSNDRSESEVMPASVPAEVRRVFSPDEIRAGVERFRPGFYSPMAWRKAVLPSPTQQWAHAHQEAGEA
jgi:hypothetical protein